MITPEGDYLSNLSAPDLRPYFKHLHWRRMGHSMGHLVASDWADKAEDDPVFGLYKKCGLWTRDEAAILYNMAREWDGGSVLDIGAHSGWTTAHLLAAGGLATGVDPMLRLQGFHDRFMENTASWFGNLHSISWKISNEYFAGEDALDRDRQDGPFGLVVIDGDHSEGKPQEDAENAARHLAENGVIIFHDGIGRPVREGVTWLLGHDVGCPAIADDESDTVLTDCGTCCCGRGFKARCYWTPHIVFVCWRGDFEPPVHESDPRINWAAHKAEMSKDFDFSRLS